MQFFTNKKIYIVLSNIFFFLSHQLAILYKWVLIVSMVAYVYTWFIVGTYGILLLEIELYINHFFTFNNTIDLSCPVFKNKRVFLPQINIYQMLHFNWWLYYEWIIHSYTVLDLKQIVVGNYQSIINLTVLGLGGYSGPGSHENWIKIERLCLLTVPKYTPRSFKDNKRYRKTII